MQFIANAQHYIYLMHYIHLNTLYCAFCRTGQARLAAVNWTKRHADCAYFEYILESPHLERRRAMMVNGLRRVVLRHTYAHTYMRGKYTHAARGIRR